MRKELLISLLSIFLLINSVNLLGRINYNTPDKHEKTTTTKTGLSTAFSWYETDIELAVFQVVIPTQISVEKRELFQSFFSAYDFAVRVNRPINLMSQIVAVIAANDYKLLFPFHHFW